MMTIFRVGMSHEDKFTQRVPKASFSKIHDPVYTRSLDKSYTSKQMSRMAVPNSFIVFHKGIVS